MADQPQNGYLDLFIDPHGIIHRNVDLFLSTSHSSKDVKSVSRLVQILHDKQFRMFSTAASVNIPPGMDFMEVIEEYLRNAKTVLVCWTKAATLSEWVLAEADLAFERGSLVSCKISKCKIPKKFETFQYADLTDWKGETEHPALTTLLETLELRKEGNTAPLDIHPKETLHNRAMYNRKNNRSWIRRILKL